MDRISVSFTIGNKTVKIEREVERKDLKVEIESLLQEAEDIGGSKATAGQMRALYGKALDQEWDRERIKLFLEERLGTSNQDKIVGVVERAKISHLIDEIGSMLEVPGKATVGQMRALWGKAFDKGWSRERVKRYLEEKLGTSREEEIVGKIDKDTLSDIIDAIGMMQEKK
jgi:hypothetical protein